MRNAILFILCVCFAASCSTSKKSRQESMSVVSIAFNADSAYAFCAAQCSFGPRIMNSEAHDRCADWIEQKFTQYGYGVTRQQADLKGYDGTVLHATNIIATAPDSQSSAAKPRILVCAHWDSRPWADNDPDSVNWRKPVMAANDGASGVAVMLELARVLQQNDSARVAVDFICFDAEDYGYPQWETIDDPGNTWALGAQYWAANPHVSGYKARYGILLDMVGGQGAQFYQEIMSKYYAKHIVDKVWRAASVVGYGSSFPTVEGAQITDDHIPVNTVANIPCIDIIPYYPNCEQSSFGPTWHTVNDDMAHLDKNTLLAVGQTIIQVLFSEK